MNREGRKKMSNHVLRFIGASICLLVWTGCASKPAPTTPAELTAGTAQKNQLSSIQVEDRGQTAAVVISGSQPVSPNIFKLTDPDRIIVDLTDTTLGSVQGPIDVKNGGIQQISVSQFDDANSSLSRIVVNLDQAAEYQVSVEGNKLTVSIQKSGGSASATAEAGLPVVPETGTSAETQPVAEAPAPLEALPALEATPTPEEPTPVAEVAAPPPAAETVATKLLDVQYASSGSGTTVTLVGDGSIADYEDRVLTNPSRIVVDLRGLKNAYQGGKTITLGTPEVKQLRLGPTKGKVRLVVDVGGTGKPAYTIDRSGNSLVMNVATAAAEAPSPTAESAPEAAPATEGVPSVEAAAPETPAAETAAPSMEAAPVPSAPMKPVMITGLGFKQMKEERKSRLIIGLSEPTSDYSTREEGPGTIVLEVQNARLQKSILKREFNTSEFQTAIMSISPKENRKTKVATLTIALEQQVPYRVSQEGNSLFVDVDIPDQILRKQTPTVAKSESAAPPPPPADETNTEAPSAAPETEGEATGAGAVDVAGFRKEKMLGSEEVTPIQEQKDLRPKNYRYVKEEFLSDSTSSGEPLSSMGQILAGEFAGKKFTGRKISLDFKDAEIRSIFRLLADISKLNMIISDEVGGRVTVRLDNVPWDQAFAIILQTKGLWFEKYGNIVRIAPADKLRQERELAAAAARASQASKPLDVLFKPVSYAQAGELTRQVKSVLSDRGMIDIDSRTNTLIIKDIRENLEKAKRMVEVLDTQTPQVSIEARIVEANTNYTRSFGIIWGGQARFTAATGNPSGVFFPNSANLVGGANGLGTSFSGLPVALNYPSPLGVNSGIGIRFGSINNILDLDLALGVLETQGQAKLISSPKITVLDNKSANIQAGSKIPFLTQTANAGSNVRFESATTSLQVTPHITNDGSVLLTINATRNEPNFAQLVQGNPLVDQRSANTEVLVKSGNTTVLGGIYSIRTGGTQDDLPGLSKIPIIGWLFKNYAKELRRTELLIFVTPRIVGDEREAVRDIRG